MPRKTKTPGTSRFVKRILLCGLEKSGRSSIRKVAISESEQRRIEEHGAVLSYFQWRVTKEYDSPTITVLDLGGQWSALDKFLETVSPSVFFGIHTLLFIVSMAEEETFTAARDFFQVILQRIKEYNPSVQVFIFLHKIDLLPMPNERQKAVKLLKNLFQELSTEKLAFYETTIHDDSINCAFLDIFKETMPDMSNQIEERFQDRVAESVSHEEMLTSSDPINSEVLQKRASDPAEAIESEQFNTETPTKIPSPAIRTSMVSSAPKKDESEQSAIKTSLVESFPDIPIPPVPGGGEDKFKNQKLEIKPDNEAILPSIPNPLVSGGVKALDESDQPTKLSSEAPLMPSIPTPSIDLSLPSVSAPQVSNPSLNMGESLQDVQDASKNPSQLLTTAQINLLQEFFTQMQTAMKLTTVSLVARDGGTLIHIGDNLEHFSETITIAHRVFKTTYQQVTAGLAQLIIEMSSDSFVTVSHINEFFVLVTTGETPPIPEFSHELFEFARKTAKHIQ